MLKAHFTKYILNFITPGGTSRGILHNKESWFIIVHGENSSIQGIGECGLLRGLSMDDTPGYESKIEEVCKNINQHRYYLAEGLVNYPSIRFGLEMAMKDLKNNGNRIFYPSGFTKGQDNIEINGLVWMGSYRFMREQIINKIKSGYTCIKLKIGAIDFEEEINLIKSIRNEFNSSEIEIRVDANGAFDINDALEKIKRLSGYDLHSIEQPFQKGQWQEMAKLCEKSPLPVALDEELVGTNEKETKKQLLNIINPQYIVLKPSLSGGFIASEEWIELADKKNIGWWITSALESNIGLNAIAQWTFTLNNHLPQGLGTGQLYSNNVESPLFIEKGKLKFKAENNWNMNKLTK